MARARAFLPQLQAANQQLQSMAPIDTSLNEDDNNEEEYEQEDGKYVQMVPLKIIE